MAQFDAEVRLFDLPESDELSARKAVDERLRAAGFSRWRIIRVGQRGAIHQPPTRQVMRPMPARRPRTRPPAEQGAWVVLAALAWAIWFVWLLGG